MTLSSRHRIRISSPGGLRPSTLHLGHGGSPQYWVLHVDGEETFLFLSAKTGNRTPNSSVKGSGANHYPRAPAPRGAITQKALIIGGKLPIWAVSVSGSYQSEQCMSAEVTNLSSVCQRMLPIWAVHVSGSYQSEQCMSAEATNLSSACQRKLPIWAVHVSGSYQSEQCLSNGTGREENPRYTYSRW